MTEPYEPVTRGEQPEPTLFDEDGLVDHEHRPRRGCLPLLLVGVLVVALVVAVGWVGKNRLEGLFHGPPDYPGPGSGHVVVQVHTGDTATAIGQTLKAAGVVKSIDAFTAAARNDPKSASIQVGYYRLKKQMKASAALDVLINPKNLVQSVVVVPEGARVRDVIGTIVAHTKISRHALVAALSDPSRIGLPAEAGGNPEGYLFPASYTVAPGESAVKLLRQMVAKTVQVQRQLGVDAGARRLGLTPEQLVTVASILEYEAKRDQDYPKVARAIYNRLKKGMPLQSDATVSYANGISGQIWTTASQRANASPYNTYQHTGLPPGPIGSPGEKTLKAAMHPANGPWLYWVVVNLRTGQTVFSTTLAEHNAAVQQFRDYCKTSSAC
ncbi:endolytic transglycosylase MltG [Nocardioides terrisoli]|uniref:endolytic transglycosylase MltG n=1 Tax=Nocardioides terrisoli TaxID=3388267 RepID=UPI00287B946A|nr:endolytic transglycosylase MltG [Nocardioides marmorisolisilvae]